jgi:hypothetical protein
MNDQDRHAGQSPPEGVLTLAQRPVLRGEKIVERWT